MEGSTRALHDSCPVRIGGQPLARFSFRLMDHREAADLIADAVGQGSGVWADLGAGTGTFTRALLSLLRPGSRVYAVDNDTAAITALRKLGDSVIAVRADFSKSLEFPEASIDGMLLANSLHFVPDVGVVLKRLVGLVKPGGRVVVVEYDRRSANPWVPYPVGSDRWPGLAATAGLVNPGITARRKSMYAGELYVASADVAGT
jgi:SAM-dependent methyltransferase